VLVVAAGKLMPDPAPRSLIELQALMRRGIGLCVRRSERHDAELNAFASSFSECLGRRVHLQVFATPRGTHGFSWHYDAEDVFIVQTAGVKDYYFRENTVDRRAPDGARPDFSRFRVETSPLQTARLIPGDCLYIPARWWHMAKCVEDALSMSLGIWEPLPKTTAALHLAE
jgi:50S ribosomal protein L16 3-hydroxylase